MLAMVPAPVLDGAEGAGPGPATVSMGGTTQPQSGLSRDP